LPDHFIASHHCGQPVITIAYNKLLRGMLCPASHRQGIESTQKLLLHGMPLVTIGCNAPAPACCAR
jgi:hypothetical protein